MESTLGNLQKIEDLRVISRTSVEKYRDTEKGIPEIAKDLNVNYLVEGSGQRVGDEILLNIQLIEASSDRPIWVEQYSREVIDIFALQKEIAQKIAAAIKAIVTPAELEQPVGARLHARRRHDQVVNEDQSRHRRTVGSWRPGGSQHRRSWRPAG